MEEKYPIKFTLGQFILFIGVQLIIFSLVFLLGARFGGAIFPGFYAGQSSQKVSEKAVTHKEEFSGTESQKMDRLVDTLEPEPEENDPGAGAPHFQVGANGELESSGTEQERVPQEEEQGLAVNRRLIQNPVDKNTVIRFKSSNNSKFAVEVGEYFDEMLASRKIDQLKEKGYDAYLVIKNPQAASPSFAVRIGVFADRKMAEDFASELSNRQGLELRVVQVD